MGEMWKKMPDEAKKPFFKEAREKAMKHKKVIIFQKMNQNQSII